MVGVCRSVGYLVGGIGLLLVAHWALAYLLSPAFFRAGITQGVLLVAGVAAIVWFTSRPRPT